MPAPPFRDRRATIPTHLPPVASTRSGGRPSRRGYKRLGLAAAADLDVDLADLLHPAAAIRVLQAQDVLEGPVEMVGDIGYLLVEALQGVAYDPPVPAISTSNAWPHSGQVTGIMVLPSSLIRR